MLRGRVTERRNVGVRVGVLVVIAVVGVGVCVRRDV